MRKALSLTLIFLFALNANAFFSSEAKDFAGLKWSYSYEKNRIVCKGYPRFGSSRIRDSVERRALQREEDREVEVKQSYCLDKGRLVDHYWHVDKDSGQKRCYTYIVISAYPVDYRIPHEKADDTECRYAAERKPNNSDKRKLKLDTIESLVHSKCSEMESCLKVLSTQAGELPGQVVEIVQNIERRNFEQKINEAKSDSSYEFEREFEDLLDAFNDAMKSCRNRLPSLDELLSEDLDLMTKTLERDISVFHWFDGEKAHLSEDASYSANNLRSVIYANVMEGLFWDETVGRNMVGQGLYAATDPNATTEYGDKLLKIDIPEGSKYLDMRGLAEGFVLSDSTLESLGREGCDLSRISYPTSYKNPRTKEVLHNVEKSDLYKDSRCRKIFNRAITNKGYSFLTYGYSSKQPSFCDNPAGAISERAATVIFDTSLNFNTVDLFDRRRSEDANTYSGSLRRKHEELSVISRRLAKGTAVDSTRRDEIKEMWRERLFNCSSKYDDSPAIKNLGQ